MPKMKYNAILTLDVQLQDELTDLEVDNARTAIQKALKSVQNVVDVDIVDEVIEKIEDDSNHAPDTNDD